MNTQLTNDRIPYWDNVKALLIFLVALGHFLIPALSFDNSIRGTFYWIYLFHMPAFVFVSGYFSKRFASKITFGINKIAGFLILFACFKLFEAILNGLLTSGRVDLFNINLLNVPGAPWYLLCMAYWYILIPYFINVPPAVGITIAIFIGLLSGLDVNIGSFLSLSRCFVFFPFFIFGYYFDGSLFRTRKKTLTIVSAIIIVSSIIIICFALDKLMPFSTVIYGEKGYHLWIKRNIYGIAIRMLWYIVATALLLAVLYICPRSKTAYTFIGRRTLGIYVFHHIIKEVVERLGLYNYLPHGFAGLICCIGFTILVVTITMQKPFTELCNYAFRINITKP